MRKNHTPFWIYRLSSLLNHYYIHYRIAPQFDTIDEGLAIHNPKYLELFGKNIFAGKHLHIICSSAQPVNISCWSSKQHQGKISIGDYVLISPGVKIASAEKISIGNNCMFAAEAYISDCDWHGVYNRTRPFRCSDKVTIEDNVWVGFRSIIGKGITVGENSIIAAGSVVIDDVPSNTIVGGNPAKKIKTIDAKKRMIKREYLFNSAANYDRNQHELNKYLLLENSSVDWLRSKYFPNHND